MQYFILMTFAAGAGSAAVDKRIRRHLAFSFAFWRQCACWHLKRRRFAPVASARNYLEHTHTHTHNKPQKYKAYVCVCKKKLAKKKRRKPESFHLKFKQLLLKSFNFCALRVATFPAQVASCELLPRQMIGKFASPILIFPLFFFFFYTDKFCNEIVSAGFCFSISFHFHFKIFFFFGNLSVF